MTDFTPDRPFGLLDGDALDDAALLRAAKGALAFVAFSTSHDNSATLIDRWQALVPDVPITDGGRVDSVREAIIACAQRDIVILITSEPKSPHRFVGAALQGAAAATEFEVPCVVLTVLRNGTHDGGVAWLTDTGLMSGYGAIFAVAYAQVHGVEAVFITPTGGIDKVRSEQGLDQARALAAKATVPMSVVSDPSPIARVLRDPFRIVVHPVLDAPTGFNLLHHGELPKKATASGNPAAVVRLLEEFPGDVVAVFDGVQLLHGEIAGGRIAAGVALGVIAMAGAGTAMAPAASATTTTISGTPSVGAQTGTGHATGNTAAIYQDASWSTAVSDVIKNLHFTADEHKGGTTALHIVNGSDHEVTVQVVGEHGQGSDSQSYNQPHTVAGHGTEDVTAGAGTKQWVTATLTHIDGTPLPEPLVLLQNGHAVTITVQVQEQFIEENAPKPEPVTWTDEYTPPAPTLITDPPAPVQDWASIVEYPLGTTGTVIPNLSAPVEAPAGTVTIVEQVPELGPQFATDATPNVEPGADMLNPPPAVPGAIPIKVPQPLPDAPDGPIPPLVPVAVPQPTPATPVAQPLLPPGPDSLKAPGQVPQASPNVEPGADMLNPPPAVPQATPMKVPQPNAPVPDGPAPILAPGADMLTPPPAVPQASPNVEPGADKLTPPPAVPQAPPMKVPQPSAPVPDGSVLPAGDMTGGGAPAAPDSGTPAVTVPTDVAATPLVSPTPEVASGVTETASPVAHKGGAGSPTVTAIPETNASQPEELAHTGSSALLLGGISSILLAAGAGLAIAGRRRGDHEENGHLGQS